MEENASIGRRILEFLNRKGKTQAELARFLGTRQSTVNGWIKLGRCPAADVILPICGFLDVTAEELLGGAEAEEKLELTDDEKQLLTQYGKLDHRGRARVTTVVYEEYDRMRADTLMEVSEEFLKHG